jgi:hypothetical protein
LIRILILDNNKKKGEKIKFPKVHVRRATLWKPQSSHLHFSGPEFAEFGANSEFPEFPEFPEFRIG